MRVEKHRDLSLLHISEDCLLVIACDSCGGIGLRDMDVVKVDYEVVGYFTASVVLCELLAFRATPQMMVNNFCIEMKPTGKKILAGIKKAIDEIGLDAGIMLTGSTEENMPVVQTAIGLTCIGEIDLKTWSEAKTECSDALFVIGTPRVGEQVLMTEGVSNLKIISQINDKQGVREILPVGSKGLDYEVSELCRCNNLQLEYIENIPIDIHKSAGPVTCFLVTGDKIIIEKLLDNLGVVYHYLGKFIVS